MRPPILTLTTDFGASDHYVGAMKGVILSICPHAQIVDICHDVTPFQIAEGAYVIAQAYACFPKKTVHVVVVDPGVGTARRPILLEAAGQYFVGPDNGVLSMLYSAGKHKVRLIANHRYFRQPVSATFHGRDIFAPVAAHVAAGVAPSRMGKPIEDYLRPEFAKPERSGKRAFSGSILKIDRFGNVVTNFHARDFPELCPSGTDAFVCQPAGVAVAVGRRQIAALSQNYAESRPGALFLIVGSSGYLEISVNQGSAAKQIGCKTGDPVTLTLR
jgi:S-adenosyl-L-methionine hydrolase (adenosine-forming)